MSFYGQALYEFTKLFHRIIVKNNGFDIEDNLPEKASAAADFSADERWDKLVFDTGNHWIDLATSNGVNGNTITISHSAPGNISQTGAGFIEIEEDKNAIELKPGQVFATTTANYDSAGHLVGELEISAYKLPPSIVQIEGGDKIISQEDSALHFNGDDLIILTKAEADNDILQFNHALATGLEANATSQGFVKNGTNTEPPEGIVAEDIINLGTGDYCTTDNIQIDEAGHINGIEKNYFKLPYETFNQSFDTLNAHMEEVKNSGLIDKNENGEYIVKTALEKIDNFPNDYLTIEKAGDLNTIYPYSFPTNTTFVSTLGPVNGQEGYSHAIAILRREKDDDYTKIFSLSQAITEIANQVSGQSDSIRGVSSRLDEVITRLGYTDI